MKNLFLTAVFLLFSFGAIAQTSNASFVEKQFPGDAKAAKVAESAIAKNLNDRTSAVRTTWLANRPKDNWFISLEYGANLLISEHFNSDGYSFKDNLKFYPTAWSGALGKWFSPVWGLRISGGTGTVESYNPSLTGTWFVGKQYGIPTVNRGALLNGDNGGHQFSYTDVTLDFMVNLKNLFTRYKPKGFFDPVVYAGVGTVRTWGADDNSVLKKILTLGGGEIQASRVHGIQNMAGKAGLQLNFRLCDPLQLYLAAEGLIVPENFDRYVGDRLYEGVASAKVGLTYRFGFRHFIKAEFCDQDMIDALIRENNELRNRKFDCPPAPACPPCPEPQVIKEEVVAAELAPVFFTINSNVVRDTELIKVVRAADYLLNHPNAKLTLKGYADKKTGSSPYNMQLSKKRVDAVAKLLVDKFGIKKDRLELVPYGDTVQPFAKNEENRVTIFVK